MENEIRIRLIQESDLTAFKALRLEALRSCPEAFGTDFEEDSKQPESVWIERVAKAAKNDDGTIFVVDAGRELVGMMGIYRNSGAKRRHSAGIWGVYVRPAFRGKNLAMQMVERVMEWCREREIRIVRLTVSDGNRAAIACYEKCGFVASGTSREEIRVGETYFDELMMWRRP
jgi:RimJ/RimL family protein N-acetyltransferase